MNESLSAIKVKPRLAVRIMLSGDCFEVADQGRFYYISCSKKASSVLPIAANSIPGYLRRIRRSMRL